jgi:hypothetical protein
MSVRYSVPDDIIDRGIGDELLIHHFETDEVFVLNPHAKLVFEAVKGGSSREDVQAFVAARVFCDTAELHRAIDGALDKLLAEGVIVCESEP